MTAPADVRPSPIVGSWYARDPRRLAADVDGYLAQARLPELGGTLVAVIAPHAGHRYSGPVAGYAFAALRGMAPELVALVGPMHSASPHAVLTSGHEAYETPLGMIPVDQAALDELDGHLRREAGLALPRVRRDPEHSLEIELPFLQRALGGPFRLLPVMVHAQDPELMRGLGRALAKTLEARRAALVLSTDLSHDYPQDVAQRLDAEMLRRVEAFDPEAVLEAEEEGAAFACGAGALAAGLWAAQGLGADRARVLRHATSGDATGEYDRVVGYAAAVVTRGRRQEEREEK